MKITDNDSSGNIPEQPEKISRFKGCGWCLLMFALLSGFLYWCGYKLYHKEIYRGEILSPCGKYRIDYYYYAGESVIPMTPGSSSDKAGCIYIYRQADNKKLFREELPMIQLAGDISFHKDKKGNTRAISAPGWLFYEIEKDSK